MMHDQSYQNASSGFYTPEQVASMPQAPWFISKVLPAQGLGAIFGPAGVGKSVLSLDLSFSLASGSDWFGYKVKKCPVIYCALEGSGGYEARLKAYFTHNPPTYEEFNITFDQINFKDEDSLLQFKMDLFFLGFSDGVIIIDTLNLAAGDSDENSSKDMGVLIAKAKELQKAFNSLVLFVHHTGKDTSKGLRGHSSLLGALDVAIEVRQRKGCREWEVVKLRDGASGVISGFNLMPVEIGTDVFGDVRESCVIVPAAASTDINESDGNNLIGNNKIVFDVIQNLIEELRMSSMELSEDGMLKVSIDDVINVSMFKVTAADPKRRKERVKKALTDIINKKVVQTDDQFLWI